MANTPVTGTINYSGATTSTDVDVLTLTGWNTSTGGRIQYVLVTNRHASLILYVRTDATAPTAAAADGTVIINPGVTHEVAVEPVGMGAGTVTVRVISSAAAPYNVVARRAV